MTFTQDHGRNHGYKSTPQQSGIDPPKITISYTHFIGENSWNHHKGCHQRHMQAKNSQIQAQQNRIFEQLPNLANIRQRLSIALHHQSSGHLRDKHQNSHHT